MDVIEMSKLLAVGAFTKPTTDWLDAVKEAAISPEMAFTSLAFFFGHLLAGAALELNVRPLPTEVGGMIADTMRAEMAPRPDDRTNASGSTTDD